MYSELEKPKPQALSEKKLLQKIAISPAKVLSFSVHFLVIAVLFDLCCWINIEMCANEEENKHFGYVGISKSL